MNSNIPPRTENESDDYLAFFGKGSTYFGIVVVNVVLTLITLGLYYPWAKAAYRKYLWNETEFNDSRFVFNGTGKEMFKGFLIMYSIFISFYISILVFATSKYGFLFILSFYLLLIALIPFAIFGGWKYRVSRTSWRGIFFAFDGNLSDFMVLFFKNLALTIITFGIYGSWMRVNIQRYLFSHTQIGDLRFDFKGHGSDLFGINILGFILLYPTLFLYLPIFIKNRFNFTVNYTYLQDGSKRQRFISTLENGTAWQTLVVNGLLLIVTLGLAFPWTFMRTMRMYMDHVIVPDAFNYDELTQSDNDYTDASGDELSDMMDIDFGF
jgi:uncharacterized membrane protein YjgN (DUF898 family)